jgi:putative MATE family efflux protein
MNEAFLRGPIAPQLVRLAWPILVVLAVQTIVSVAETYFVGFLGTHAIAGVALVFPLLMLMTMMSNGGIGGGVSSAIARAIGAGRKRDADLLVGHAVVIAVILGGLFTASALLGGPLLYKAMGGDNESLASALLYSNLVFGAAIPIWVANLLASALRGAGNVRVPAIITAAGAVLTLALSPPLILGWGPVPRFGVAGAGYAMILYYVLATAGFIVFLRSKASPVRLSFARIEMRLFKEILGVGLLSALGTVLANATVVLLTGLVGLFGASAIAGYGMAARLDYLLIPLLFALGTASVTMVGTSIGAGHFARARRIAWTAAFISAGVTGVIGLAAALAPELWMRIFSADADVIAAGAGYLRRAAPFYGLYGVGMAFYFASQGAGNVRWPVIAGVIRLLVATVGGWYWVVVLKGSMEGLYWFAAASLALFGIINAAAFATGLSWGQRPAASRKPGGHAAKGIVPAGLRQSS